MVKQAGVNKRFFSQVWLLAEPVKLSLKFCYSAFQTWSVYYASIKTITSLFSWELLSAPCRFYSQITRMQTSAGEQQRKFNQWLYFGQILKYTREETTPLHQSAILTCS